MTEWEQEQEPAGCGREQDYEHSTKKEDTRGTALDSQLPGPVTTHTNPTTTKPKDEDD